MSATQGYVSETGGDKAEQPSPLSVDGAQTRLQLIWRLADVLTLPEGRTTANDRAMVADLMSSVLGAADPDLRAEVGARLAQAPNLPPSLMRQIACDIAPVASPIIGQLADLPEAILVEAAGVSVEHRRVLARRDTISSGLAEALLAHDEADIVAAVLPRENVQLSLHRIELLVRRSRNDVACRKPLLSRPELQPAQGFAMFWWCGAPDRRRILARFAMDRTVVQDTLQPLFPVVFTAEEPDPLVKRLLRVIDRRHRPRGENGEVVAPEIVERTLMAARATPAPDFCQAVGLLAGVSKETATRVMHDAGGEPFAILAKSAGLSRGAFKSVLDGAAAIGWSGGPAFDENRREALLATFDTVARDYARAVLQYWDWRPAGLAVSAATSFGAVPASASDAEEDAAYLGAV